MVWVLGNVFKGKGMVHTIFPSVGLGLSAFHLERGGRSVE